MIECGVPTLTAHLLSSLSCIHSGVRFRALNVVPTVKKEGILMVSNCANSGCSKPLHYLREGRIYIFEASARTTEPGAKRMRCLEHYWLCGVCAETLMLVQDEQGIVRVRAKPATISEHGSRPPAIGSMFAS